MKRMGLRAAAGAALLLAFLASPLHSQTFHKYVALGDSLTAGFEGLCLVERHQQRSYPKLVADALGISDFQQPLVRENALSNPPTPPVCQGAVFAANTITVGAVSQQGTPRNETVALARPYDNLGIVGANAADLVDLRIADTSPSGNTANRFAALVLRNVRGSPFEGRNAVEEANALNPDFVTVWVGPNDVLGAALAGTVIEGVTLTPVAVFEAKYTQILTGLQATGRTLVVLNVPDVTSIAFTTTIPRVVVNPTTRQPVLVGGNPVPLLGPQTTSTCATAPCPLPDGTLVTLGASSFLLEGRGIPAALGGTGQPLPDSVLLYPEEVALIRQRETDINARIASIAAANGATVIDMHALFVEIARPGGGYDAGGGIVITTSFLTGGLFSADGFHPSNIGYAIVAKEIIDHLNATKGTHLELDLAHTLFEPDVLAITPTGIVDPAAGPYGFSRQMWKDLVATAAPGIFDFVFPAPAKRAKQIPGQ